MRYAAKVDRGAQAIVANLRAAGAHVVVIKQPVDLLCGYRGRNVLLEIKAAGARKRKDQPKQDRFLATWPGQVAVVRTSEEALLAIGART